MIPFRQIHLDFHTPELPFVLGNKFDSKEFQNRLQTAHVNSITLTARDHHGYIFYDSKLPAKHPQMKNDFLMEAVDAAHQIGVRCPLYVSAGYDAFMAKRHPEWLERRVDGSLYGAQDANQLGPGWRTLCFNTPYVDYLREQVVEMLTHFEGKVDGVFFDIVRQDPCLCDRCIDKMLEDHLDPQSSVDRETFAANTVQALKQMMTQTIHKMIPDCPIFYNAGNITPEIRSSLKDYDHLEIESLASGTWGYQHFPVTVRYAKTLGKPYIGMTGKFQRNWADFGSLKNLAALAYECYLPLAHGAGCSIGDQMYPDGTLQEATYREIGEVYANVEKLEPYLVNQQSTADIAIMHTQINGPSGRKVDSDLAGATNMLNEAHYQFDIIDHLSKFDSYHVLILPDSIRLTNELARKLEVFVSAGGKLLLTYQSGMMVGNSDFAKFLGIHNQGESVFHPTYVRFDQGSFVDKLGDRELVLHGRALDVISSMKIIAERYNPMFNRTYRHYYSHAQAPIAKKSDYPFGVYDERIVYLSNDLFTMYKQYGVAEYRQIVLNALTQLLKYRPRVITNAPVTADVILNKQGATGYLLHYLNYVPTHRSEALDVIEAPTPVLDTHFQIQFTATERVTKIECLRNGETLTYAQNESGTLSFDLPLLRDYEVISIVVESSK